MNECAVCAVGDGDCVKEKTVIYHRKPVVDFEGEFIRFAYLRGIRKYGETPICCGNLVYKILERHRLNTERLYLIWRARDLLNEDKEELEIIIRNS